MKHFIVIFLLVSLSSCVNKNAKLVDGKSNIYNGGIIGQTVDGDSFSVSVWNIWNANDEITQIILKITYASFQHDN